ncbi:MAG: hypothetical protein AB7O63_11835 [Reyranellaceae bacterium]
MILVLRIILLAGWLIEAWLWFELLKDVGLPPKPAPNDWLIPLIPLAGAFAVVIAEILARIERRRTAKWITWLSFVSLLLFTMATANAVFTIGSIRDCALNCGPT